MFAGTGLGLIPAVLMIRRRATLLMVATALMAVAACTQQSPDAPSPAATQPPVPATVTLIISTQPRGQTIKSGDHVTLSVFAGGNGSLSYQWYVGTSGNTSAPISGETTLNFTTPALTQTTDYWVRVSDSTGHVDSVTATITVPSPGAAPAPAPTSTPTPTPTPPGATPAPTPTSTPTPTPTPPSATPTPSPTPSPSPSPTPTPTPPAASAPSIVSQPASQSVQSGQTVTLSVTAFGSVPLSYQWYVGSSGQTSAPISGANGVTYTSPPLSSTTLYWVRVSNPQGSADSVTVTITVNVGRRRRRRRASRRRSPRSRRARPSPPARPRRSASRRPAPHR